MTDREAFKVGFMANCIDAGLTTPEEMLGALEKSALSLPGEKLITDTLGTAAKWLIPAAIAGPPIAGYALGRLAGNATDIDETDTDDVKRQELISEYKRQAALLRQRSRSRGQ
jgi:hypothetical protein